MSPNVHGVTDQSAVITHHEAGHAVAALMTVNTEPGEQMTVNVGIVAGGGTGHNADVPLSGHHPVQAAFVFYAGPWAEARVKWGKPVHGLDDTDGDGVSFRRVLTDTVTYGPGSDGLQLTALADAFPTIPDNEPYWSAQLESAWPVIAILADALRGRLNHAQTRPYLPELGGDRTMKFASMTYREVVELVEPLLQACGMWRYLA